MKIKTFNDFKKYMGKAYDGCNFFDCQLEIEELKKSFSEKKLIKLIKEQLKIRIDNIKKLRAATRKLEEKYEPRDYYIWEEALDYISHKYQRGEYVFFYYHGLHSGKISKLTKKGYKIFVGRKIGIEPEVTFKNVICHVSNTKRILEEIKKQNDNKIQ